MLMNRLIGVALALGVIVVSVHAYNPDLSKTENLAAHVVTYKTTQRQIIIDDADTLATVTLRFAPCPPPTIRQVSFEQRIDFIKRFIAPTTAAAATIKVNKSRPIISKKKITLRKSNLSKTKTHAHKFFVPHHHKSHHHNHHGGHHHGGHHHGGHHHSGPQKISGGPPSHLTGCGS